MNGIDKLFAALYKYGFLNTTFKILKHPFCHLHYLYNLKIKERVILKLDNIEDRFIEIYNANCWGNKKSVSGGGSTLKYTENLREK